MDRHSNASENKYAQQHLANERTYLAWIRTAITIVGLGFLVSGVIFKATPYFRWERIIAVAAGLGSLLLGCLLIALATRSYFRHRADINGETFRSAGLLIALLFSGLFLISLLLLVLMALILFVG